MERKFAQGTKITSEKSEGEIRTMLKKFGATRYGYLEDDTTIGFTFDYENRRVRISLPLPDPDADEFTFARVNQTSRMAERSQEQKLKLWQDECNRQWRALVLTVKAKLISVQEGIRTFEQEFLYDIVIPATNQTVGEYMRPQLEQAYLTGKLPPMLPGIGETSGD